MSALGNLSGQVSGLRAQLTYVVFVAAVNVVGAGEPGTVSNARTGPPQVPSAPPSLRVVTSDGSSGVLVVGLPIDDGGAYPTSLSLTVVPSAGQSSPGCATNGSILAVTVPAEYLTVGSGEVQVAVTSLAAQCAYSVSAAWTNAGGTGAAITVDSALVTGAAVPPSAPPPTPDIASVGPSAITLCWPGQPLAAGAPVLHWVLHTSLDGVVFDDGAVVGADVVGGGQRLLLQQEEEGSPMTPLRDLLDALYPPLPAVQLAPTPRTVCHTVRALRASTLYFFTIRAATALGVSPPSSQPTILSTAASVPATPPVNLRVTSMSPTQVTLSWDPPVDLDGAPLMCYTVDRALDGVADNACALPTFNVSAGAWTSGLDGPGGPAFVGPLDPNQLSAPSLPLGLPGRFTPAATPADGVYASTVADCVAPPWLQGHNGTGGPFLTAAGGNVTLRVNAAAVSRLWVRAVTAPPASKDVGAVATPTSLVSNYSATAVIVVPPATPAVPPAPVLLTRNATHVTVGWGVTQATGGCALSRLLLYTGLGVDR